VLLDFHAMKVASFVLHLDYLDPEILAIFYAACV
jgi:hypothetical protein